MITWSFDTELSRAPSELELDAMFEAGLDDCSPVLRRDGTGYMMCNREAATLLEAVARVARDVRRVPGLRVIGVNHDDVVTLGEAAQRLGRTTQNMHQLAKGQRGPGGFPQPKPSATNTRFYSYAEIAKWMREALGVDAPESNIELVLADMLIRAGVLAESVGRKPSEFYKILEGDEPSSRDQAA